jgi:hypothetical protein
MNENIENCLYQAGLTAQGCWDELDDYAREGIEKFAELIVRECAKVAEQWYSDYPKDDRLVSECIMETFGVEE